jgi:hypothetical protein
MYTFVKESKAQRFVLELWLDPAADEDDFQRHKSLIIFYITILLILVCQNFIVTQLSQISSSVLLITVLEMVFVLTNPLTENYAVPTGRLSDKNRCAYLGRKYVSETLNTVHPFLYNKTN